MKVVNNMKELEKIAEEAREAGNNNLAIVLLVYLGSVKSGVDNAFAHHCQDFANNASEQIKKIQKAMKGRN